MGITAMGAHRRVALAALLSLAALSAGLLADSGHARGPATTVLSQLRVEGPRGNLDAGTWYVTGTERIRRSRGDGCRHRSGRFRVEGPTALGIPQSAAEANPDVAPVRARNTDFGKFMCEIGGAAGRPGDDPDGFAGWLYRSDFVSPSVSADAFPLAGGEEVLWVFADFGERNRNTGDALELTGVPAADADGEFTVQVVRHDFTGATTPVEGAAIQGVEQFEDLGGGSYDVVADEGITTIHATRKPHVPSNRFEHCLRPNPDNCPLAHGRTIVGSPRDDELAGTAGWDDIRSREGDDEVNVAQFGRDVVSCGGGTDTVTVIKGDSDNDIAGNCEEIVEVE